MRRIHLITFLLSLAFLSGCGGEADHNVLFIGNSYTHFNDLPGIVEEIADANGVAVNTEMIAPGGAFLDEHVVNPDVIDALTSGEFDTVIFQEQSVAPSLPAFAAQRTIPAALALDRVADQSGMRVIWFQTWGRESGLPSEGHASYESMQAPIINTYNEIASQTGGAVARVGEVWQRARFSIPTTLYEHDGSHPSAAGSYLAAAEITEALILQRIVDAPAVGSVDRDLAALLANA